MRGMVRYHTIGTTLNVQYGNISCNFAFLSQNQTLQKSPLQPKWPFKVPKKVAPSPRRASGREIGPGDAPTVRAKTRRTVLKIEKYGDPACTVMCGTRNPNWPPKHIEGTLNHIFEL